MFHAAREKCALIHTNRQVFQLSDHRFQKELITQYHRPKCDLKIYVYNIPQRFRLQ
jgi:hypothetical protein